MQKLVILDTNFLLIPGQFRVDVFSELERICKFSYELCVLAEAVAELNKLTGDKKASAKDRRAAKLGIQLLKARKVEVVEVGDRKVFKSTDKAILGFAAAKNKSEPGSAVVATQDRKLRGRLIAKGVAVIILRQERYLKFYS